jgi:hypothetical protein
MEENKAILDVHSNSFKWKKNYFAKKKPKRKG